MGKDTSKSIDDLIEEEMTPEEVKTKIDEILKKGEKTIFSYDLKSNITLVLGSVGALGLSYLSRYDAQRENYDGALLSIITGTAIAIGSVVKFFYLRFKKNKEIDALNRDIIKLGDYLNTYYKNMPK